MKIGIVGPTVSVDRIMQISKELEEPFLFIPFTYSIATEVTDIVNSNPQIDFWLFSGFLPYSVAKSTGVPVEKIDFVYQSANDMYVEILHYILEKAYIPKAISFDLIATDERVVGLFQLAKMQEKIKFYTIPFKEHITVDEIYEAHFQLWKNKKVDLVITYYPTVWERLLKKNVPVYLIAANEMNIFYSLKVIIEKIKAKHYQGGQTTALMLKIKNFDQLKTVKSGGYAYEFLLLDLKRLILNCCQQLEGFLVASTPGYYLIFTARGIVEQKIHLIEETLQFIYHETGAFVFAGIGHAATAFNAEQYAGRAINHIEHLEQNMIAVMNDDGVIVERFGAKNEVIYQVVHQNSMIMKLLEQTTVSIKTYNRIAALLQQTKEESFTAKDLAIKLEMTERNAQRILSELLKVDLIRVSGAEQRNKRGRATKIYQFNSEILKS